MPLALEDILHRLSHAGYEALIVGGYVRDRLLGLPAHDADLATNASPERCQELFADAKLDLTGQRFRVLRVDGYELASFRGERYAVPGKPEVWEADSFTADAARRDFTINAMALTPEGELLDPFDGRADLAAKLVRAVGDADARFAEDPVRLLRGIGFAVRLGFEIEAKTAEAMRRSAHLLQELPGERVAQEMQRLIIHQRLAEGMNLYQRFGFLPFIVPELCHLPGLPQRSEHHHLDAWGHTLAVTQKIAELAPGDRALAWAALFHDCGKGIPLGRETTEGGLIINIRHETESERRFRAVSARLALGHDITDAASFFIRWHMPRDIDEPGAAVRFLNLLARSWRSKEELRYAVERLQLILIADAYGKQPGMLAQHLERQAQVSALLECALDRVPFYYRDADLTGEAFLDQASGAEIGNLMRRKLLTLQSENVQKWYDEKMPLSLPDRPALPQGAVLRRAETRDIPRLRVLINAAYSELGAMGFNFSGVTQDEEETSQRMAGKEVWLIEQGERLLATIALNENLPGDKDDLVGAAWYISQFGVDPEIKKQGLGTLLMYHAFDRARELGYHLLRLDTAVPAHHLVRLYRRFGFRTVWVGQWRGKTYPSFIMEAHVTTVKGNK